MKKLRTILLIAASLLLLSSCETSTIGYPTRASSEITLATQQLFDREADTMLVYITPIEADNSLLLIGTLDHKLLYVEQKKDTAGMAFLNLMFGIIIGAFVSLIFFAFLDN